MTKYREILRLVGNQLTTDEIVAACSVSSKTVVKVKKRAAELGISWPLSADMTDEKLKTIMFPEPEKPVSTKRMPDFEYIRKELLRNGVNKRLLWDEYFEQCRRDGADALMYSQFCYYIQQDEAKRRATMHVPRKPGQQIEVDWAGDTASVIDRDTGESIKVYVFVAAMSYSTYAFAEGFPDMKQASWIKANVHMLEYIGGVPKMIIPDNTSTAVNHNGIWKEREINKTYQEFAEHYNTAIIPARVRHPKDYRRKSVIGNLSLKP
jgi:transposase